MNFEILGTGSYVPDKIVTNDDMSKLVETSDEWIQQRVGVKQRRVSENETATDMAYNAAGAALESCGVLPEELDLIIAASLSSDSACPTVAGEVQSRIGAVCPAFDINSACSGFLFALETVSAFFAKGGVKKALVIGAERMSRIIDWSDRSTCVIFGDGAGAAVLGEGNGYLSSVLSTKGGRDVIDIPAFGGESPFYKREKPQPYIFMKGQETFKFAVNSIVDDIKETVSRADIAMEDVKYIVPHQANIRIIQFASKKLKIPMDKFFVNIDKYGNTSAASVPMALDELNRQGGLQKGDIIVLSAFGGGLSSAACVIKW